MCLTTAVFQNPKTGILILIGTLLPTETPNLTFKRKDIVGNMNHFIIFVFSIYNVPHMMLDTGTNMNKTLPYPPGAYRLLV